MARAPDRRLRAASACKSRPHGERLERGGNVLDGRCRRRHQPGFPRRGWRAGRPHARPRLGMTPLGPPETWPQSLKTAVRIMLTSRQPIWIGWGEELSSSTTIPTSPSSAASIPGARAAHLGRVAARSGTTSARCWRTAMTGVEGTFVEEQLLVMERNGYPEETYYTFSYSPIRDDDGSAGGIICANSDDTRRVIGDRQLALLRELAAGAADARNWQEACRRSAQALGTDALRPAVRHDLHGGAGGGHVSLAGACGIEPRPSGGAARHGLRPPRALALRRGAAQQDPRVDRRPRVAARHATSRRATGPSRRPTRPFCRSCPAARPAAPACSSSASTPIGCSTRAIAAFSSWSPARSRPRSPMRRPTRRSAAAPRRWPRSTAPRRPSSPTSATSSARR